MFCLVLGRVVGLAVGRIALPGDRATFAVESRDLRWVGPRMKETLRQQNNWYDNLLLPVWLSTGCACAVLANAKCH